MAPTPNLGKLISDFLAEMLTDSTPEPEPSEETEPINPEHCPAAAVLVEFALGYVAEAFAGTSNRVTYALSATARDFRKAYEKANGTKFPQVSATDMHDALSMQIPELRCKRFYARHPELDPANAAPATAWDNKPTEPTEDESNVMESEGSPPRYPRSSNGSIPPQRFG